MPVSPKFRPSNAMDHTLDLINFTPPGVAAAVAPVPTGGDNSDFEIEYIEEEVEEELPTDDESVAVLQHDQRQEPDTSTKKNISEFPVHPKVEVYCQPPSPQTPEDCKQEEFVKGTHKASCFFEPFKYHIVFFLFLANILY